MRGMKFCAVCSRRLSSSDSMKKGVCGMCPIKNGVTRSSWMIFPAKQFSTRQYAELHNLTSRHAARRLHELACAKRSSRTTWRVVPVGDAL